MSAFRNQDTKGSYNTHTFEKIYETARSLVTEQYKLYNDVLLPSLEKQKYTFFRMRNAIVPKRNGCKNTLGVRLSRFWFLLA